MSSEQILVTVLVVTYRGAEFIGECLRSLAAQNTPHQLLVIDNASTDGTQAILTRDFPLTQVIRLPRNTGFAGAVAAGLKRVRTPFVALLNDDATAATNWLAELLTIIQEQPRTAAVTSRMWLTEPPDHLNNIGIAMTYGGYGYDIGLGQLAEVAFTRPTPVFGFSGGAALLRTDELRAVGGSPVDFFLYYEDVDISWRLRLAGWEIVSVPDAEVVHRHSATVGQTSPFFHRYNERNRLMTLLRCAPLPVFLSQVGRFVLTTASLTAKRLLKRQVPETANFSPRLRLSVLGEILWATPRLIRERHRISDLAVCSRDSVAGQWLGADPYGRAQ